MGSGSDEAFVRELLDALADSLDAAKLRERLDQRWGRTADQTTDEQPERSAAAALSPGVEQLQSRIGLVDILDDSILHARPGDKAFPLRILFGQLVSDSPHDDTAFALASGLNFFFRMPMVEDAKLQVGLEISRLYYRFAQQSLERKLVAKLSPLLAKLMSTELDRLRFESVDHVAVFDSAMHERETSADPTGSAVRAPRSFLCRVNANDRIRVKAIVST